MLGTMKNLIYKQPTNFKKIQILLSSGYLPSELVDGRVLENPYSSNEIFLTIQLLNQRRNSY